MLNDFSINLIAGLVGAFILYIIQVFYKYITEQRSPFTGIWEGNIYDTNGAVIKRDIFRIHQRGNTIQGVIVRDYPNEQHPRNWHVSGKLIGREFFGIFWPKSGNITSHGSFYLTQVGDKRFVGYYMSLHLQVDKNNNTKEIMDPVKCSLVRTS